MIMMIISLTGVCEKTFLLREPWPCNKVTETPLQPLSWCYESLSSQSPSSPDKLLFPQTQACLMCWFVLQHVLFQWCLVPMLFFFNSRLFQRLVFLHQPAKDLESRHWFTVNLAN